MICIQCSIKEGPTPKARFCTSCYVRDWREKNKERNKIYSREYNREYQRKNGYSGQKEKVFERDNYTCRSCKVTKVKLHIHHIDGKGSTVSVKEQNNNLSNLVTLCVSCHSKIEVIRRGPSYVGLQGKWARYFDKCISCGTDEKKHYSKGFCSTCSEKARKEYKKEWYLAKGLLI